MCAMVANKFQVNFILRCQYLVVPPTLPQGWWLPPFSLTSRRKAPGGRWGSGYAKSLLPPSWGYQWSKGSTLKGHFSSPPHIHYGVIDSEKKDEIRVKLKDQDEEKKCGEEDDVAVRGWMAWMLEERQKTKMKRQNERQMTMKQVWSTNKCVLLTLFNIFLHFRNLKKKTCYRPSNQLTDGPTDRRSDGWTDGQTLL